jgi:hypothetical protein
VDYTGLGNFQVVATNRYASIPASTGATYEYQICFKCHTGRSFPAYADGTANFTSGSTTVTGNGTAWTTDLIGMWLACTNDTQNYVVIAVVNSTNLTLSQPYGGATAGGQLYFVRSTTAGLTPYYATGTATFTSGSTTVTGSGTSWNSGMIGSYIYGSNNPAVLYRIIAVSSATSLTIAPAYK